VLQKAVYLEFTIPKALLYRSKAVMLFRD